MERAELLTLGMFLRERREQRGLTQEELAEAAGGGLSVDTISNIERGRSRPYRQTLEALIAALCLDEAEREIALHMWRGAKKAPPSGGRDAETTRVPPRSSLIGRARELSLLERHLDGEGPPLLLFVGEPGIGKSRLLQEAAARGNARDYAVLRGECQRRSGEEPYAPLAGAIAQHLEVLEPGERRAALRECDWLVRLLPELPEPAGGLATTAAPGQERRLIFDAVRRCLRNVSGPAGALLVLDDLQWAGGDGLDLLGMLVRPPFAGSLRVVGAYRDTDTATNSSLAMLLADLASASLIRQVTLGPLTEEEARALIAAMLPETQAPARSPEIEDTIVRRCGGVPFFLTSCIQSLQAGPLSLEQPGALPRDLAEALRQRIAALPPESQDMLGVAAVIGREVRHELLAAVCELSEPALLATLDAALRSRLLVEGRDYRFAHDAIRETVEADLGPGRRMTLHRRIAEALEGRPGSPPIELLAYHYSRTGRDDKAVPYLELAGDRARAQYAGAAAAAHYRDLVERLIRLGWRGEAGRAYEKLGETLHVSGRYDEAIVALENAAERYRVDGELDGEVRAVSQIGQVYHRQGRIDEGSARLSELTTRLKQPGSVKDPRDLWRVWMALSANLHYFGRYEEQLVAAERAVLLADDAGDATARAETKLALGAGLLSARSAAEAIPVLEEAARLGDGAGALEAVRTAGYFAASAHLAQGRFGHGRVWSERALLPAERVGDPGWIALITSARGFCFFHEGNWSEAEVHLEHGAEMAHPLGASFISSWSLLYLGQFYAALGAWDEATRLFEEGIGMGEDLRWNALFWCSQSCLGELDALRGQPDKAIDRLEPALAGIQVDYRDAGALWSTLAGAYLVAGDVHRAETTVQLALAESKRRQDLTRMVGALRVRGMVLAQQCSWEQAEATFGEALALARPMPYPYAEAQTLAAYGALHERRGDLASARQRWLEALVIFRSLGARKDVERAEEALQGLGLEC